LELNHFKFTGLDETLSASKFDCGDSDINEFLKIDAFKYQEQKIANTFCFVDDSDQIIAFFSISNDCLNDLGYSNNTWNKFHRKIKLPNEKRIRQYPSVKIGRLGIDKIYQGQGLAHQLMIFIKGWTTLELKPACRLLLLDAYNKTPQLNYYSKNGFEFLLDSDIRDKTRLMYFDLSRLD
jgi:GNAT superfamily N-acetyltransferase